MKIRLERRSACLTSGPLRGPLILAMVLCTGCGSRQPQDPQQALSHYLATVSANDPERAYDLLAERTRKGISRAEFKGNWKRYQQELKVQALALRKQLHEPALLRAELRLHEQKDVRLVRRDQGWQVEDGIGLFLQTDTPEATVRSLARAVADMNLQNIYMLLAKERRLALQNELKMRLDLLPQALEKIEVTGNRARVEFGPSYVIELIKEGGQWRILEVN